MQIHQFLCAYYLLQARIFVYLFNRDKKSLQVAKELACDNKGEYDDGDDDDDDDDDVNDDGDDKVKMTHYE